MAELELKDSRVDIVDSPPQLDVDAEMEAELEEARALQSRALEAMAMESRITETKVAIPVEEDAETEGDDDEL